MCKIFPEKTIINPSTIEINFSGYDEADIESLSMLNISKKYKNEDIYNHTFDLKNTTYSFSFRTSTQAIISKELLILFSKK